MRGLHWRTSCTFYSCRQSLLHTQTLLASVKSEAAGALMHQDIMEALFLDANSGKLCDMLHTETLSEGGKRGKN